MNIEYFGTDLNQSGHYFWLLDNGYLTRNRRSFNDFPFNPEGLPYAGFRKEYKNGTVRFYNMAGFSIIAIAGSCYDKRPGSKSIFFVEEDLTREVFEEKLKSDPCAKKIFDRMPFEILW